MVMEKNELKEICADYKETQNGVWQLLVQNT